jgi:hypothetical protein
VPQNRQALIDAICRELEAAPDLVLIAVASMLGGKPPPGSEAAKVEAHYDRFSETFARTGIDKEDFLRAFATLRKYDPGYSAERFLYPNKAR